MKPSQTTRRLLTYFRPYRARLVFAVLLMALQAIIPGVLVLLIETVLDDVLIAKDHRALALMPFAVVGLYLLGGILRVGRGMLTRHIAWRVITDPGSDLVYSASSRCSLASASCGGREPGPTDPGCEHDLYGVSGIVTAIQQPLTLAVLRAQRPG